MPQRDDKKLKYILCQRFAQQESIDHGFFTRGGGTSSGIYNSLNCGRLSSDKHSNVEKNRKLVTTNLGNYKDKSLFGLKQIHSNKVVTIDNANDNEKIKDNADGLVTNVKGVVLSVLTADCAPVLFADNEAGVVAAAHAGWRGSLSGIIENTILEMEKLSAKRENIVAVIGPSISQSSYEVGQEFLNEFLKDDKNNICFFNKTDNEGKFLFNLPKYVEQKLIDNSIYSISNVNLCTYKNENSFFSYRRSCHKNEEDYGRNISVIAIR